MGPCTVISQGARLANLVLHCAQMYMSLYILNFLLLFIQKYFTFIICLIV